MPCVHDVSPNFECFFRSRPLGISKYQVVCRKSVLFCIWRRTSYFWYPEGVYNAKKYSTQTKGTRYRVQEHPLGLDYLNFLAGKFNFSCSVNSNLSIHHTDGKCTLLHFSHIAQYVFMMPGIEGNITKLSSRKSPTTINPLGLGYISECRTANLNFYQQSTFQNHTFLNHRFLRGPGERG